MIPRTRVSLGILAGGRGSRLGGVDKAFLEWQSAMLLERALAAAGPGFVDTLVSHNRPHEPRRLAFERAGVRFVADAFAAGQGPLAGLYALLCEARGTWLLSLPVDLADPSGELVDALMDTQGAIVRDGDGLQPLVGLWPVAAARLAVRQALVGAQRAVHAVAEQLQLQVLDITPRRLGNLNTPDDFRTPS